MKNLHALGIIFALQSITLAIIHAPGAATVVGSLGVICVICQAFLKSKE
ncbi:MAG TPA: hypothetical protein VL576_03175 [Candidatus Paceibacterota bacterium]|jgi:tetrahydromethanopterin S-methyltransferase subunit C|nr:hypothetical protein [Candidatus Paceibacterota bacterium]